MAYRYRRRGYGAYIWVVLLAAGILLGIKHFPGSYDSWLHTPADSAGDQQIIFDIESGDSGKTVAKNLSEEGLISNYWFFYWYLKDSELANQIQAGRFVLAPSMTPAEIAETITSGSGQMVLTIREGWTIEQIDAELVELGLISDGEFESCTQTCDFSKYSFMASASGLEGYLFPDTFFIDPAGFDSESLIERLLNNFETKVLTPETEAVLQNSGRTLDEVIIMASIVEREGLLDEDLPLIAGILWKRYDFDWGLDADATLLYVLDEEESLVENLDLDSPYNTRKYRGLPPTAISNPGLEAIGAALNPEESDYWFYLNDSQTGKAHFAVTNEEHNANKLKWL